MKIELIFLRSLFLTIFVETTVLSLLLKFTGWVKQKNWSKILGSGLWTSFATLPYFWFILPIWIKNHTLYIFAGEGFVILFEMIFFKIFLVKDWKKAFLISLICNGASIFVGKMIQF